MAQLSDSWLRPGVVLPIVGIWGMNLQMISLSLFLSLSALIYMYLNPMSAHKSTLSQVQPMKCNGLPQDSLSSHVV